MLSAVHDARDTGRTMRDNNHTNKSKPIRPTMHLHGAGHMYPKAWKSVEEERQGGISWPNWMFLPLTAWTKIILADCEPHMTAKTVVEDAMRLAAIGTWRYSQSIYRIDPVLFEALITTPLTKLPNELFFQLPEWSVYIETPGLDWMESEQYGFWAFLDRNMDTGENYLNLVIDSESDLAPISLDLSFPTIEASIQAVAHKMREKNLAVSVNVETALSVILPPLLNLVLYVCSDGVEFTGAHKPPPPTPKRTKKGWRLFPAQKSRIWELGKATGDVIRQSVRKDDNGMRSGPSPHIRRAHWHTFYKGTGESKMQFVKFLPPIPVATDRV